MYVLSMLYKFVGYSNGSRDNSNVIDVYLVGYDNHHSSKYTYIGFQGAFLPLECVHTRIILNKYKGQSPV